MLADFIVGPEGPTHELLDDKWRQALNQYNRLFVGYSGGLDSSVLLHHVASLPELTAKITAVYVNHGISPNALQWEKHCQQFCQAFAIPLLVKRIQCAKQANIEAEARKARYAVFAELLQENDCLLLAHQLNDQAETLLLQLTRGAGIDGLAAMVAVKKYGNGTIVRPFLQYSRQRLQEYAQHYQLKWIEDESNFDLAFSRNYLRHQIIPLLQERWPAVVVKLADTSKHCQQAQANLDDLARMDCPTLENTPNELALRDIQKLKPARLSNVLRSWLKFHKIRLPGKAIFNRLIHEVIGAASDANPQVTWDGITIRRYQQTLYLLPDAKAVLSACHVWSLFPKPLDLGKARGMLIVVPAQEGLAIPTGSRIEVRFRRGGEYLRWHGQTKQLKKLFQEWKIPPWRRDHIPLLYINNQLAAVAGYAVSDLFYQASSALVKNTACISLLVVKVCTYNTPSPAPGI